MTFAGMSNGQDRANVIAFPQLEERFAAAAARGAGAEGRRDAAAPAEGNEAAPADANAAAPAEANEAAPQ